MKMISSLCSWSDHHDSILVTLDMMEMTVLMKLASTVMTQ